MDISSLRVRYHLVGTVIVVLVVGAYQYWQSGIDPGFLAGVAIVYFVLSLAIDHAQNR
ncbi:hypothetical protein [Natrialba sp. INN-245]|uniref:hypothetical protein n=1 Tax=Natrialba sp. INN-245 TaxID=2690967 RepID=UPI0013111FF3|nr:hypothetical protein [Natrialba sp. INN-245]MWV38905.1 hypothetical protein [Natrialba sp. INN-245]